LPPLEPISRREVNQNPEISHPPLPTIRVLEPLNCRQCELELKPCPKCNSEKKRQVSGRLESGYGLFFSSQITRRSADLGDHFRPSCITLHASRDSTNKRRPIYAPRRTFISSGFKRVSKRRSLCGYLSAALMRQVHTSTLLVIEDVQWADEATLDLLKFLRINEES
jgi:hypothetical protein